MDLKREPITATFLDEDSSFLHSKSYTLIIISFSLFFEAWSFVSKSSLRLIETHQKFQVAMPPDPRLGIIGVCQYTRF